LNRNVNLKNTGILVEPLYRYFFSG